MSVYRKRLKEKGIIDAPVRGQMVLILPRFDVFIHMMPEDL
ncbi:MAG: hypothetical protein U0K47_00365 [Erysipelotrichaceae bacterium]|nr:hypothetical protein [Erysipelotrichaceae bacterium]MEE1333022.1 hypothetical protein [Erysipelotrichaceae bacterium]